MKFERGWFISALAFVALALVSNRTLDAQVVTTPIGAFDDRANAMAVQADGKIVVVGRTSNGTDNDIAVVRYLPTLALDTTFDVDGIVTTAVGASHDEANAVVIQPDGKIVVAGAPHNGTNTDFVVVRYNADGSLDTSFDLDGIVITQFRSPDKREIAYAVALQSDGKIVVAGMSDKTSGNSEVALARYNPDGSLDTSFDADGLVTTKVSNAFDVGYDLLVQSDGKIVVSGLTDSGSTGDFVLLRYDTSGSLDATFDGDGIVTTNVGGFTDSARGLLLQLDGKYVAGGDGSTQFVASRYDANGTLDSSFDLDGISAIVAGSGQDAVLQSDGKIILPGHVGGGSSVDFAAVRYNTDGSLDTTFDSDGVVTTDIGGLVDQSFDAAVLSDGRICLAGESDNGTDLDFALVCYDSSGSLPAGGCSPTVNLRSIGRDGGTLASAGTATINGGETTVTFTNPLPQPDVVGAVGPGDELVIGVETLYILSRDSDTQVTVQTPALADHIGVAYTITRAFSGATPIQDWETGREGDLVAENRREVGVAYKDATLPFDENVTVDGSTTDACRFMWLTVAGGQRHGGVAASTPSDHVVLDPSTAGNAFTIRDDFTRIDEFEVTGWTGVSAEAVRIEAFNLLFDQMLVHDDDATSGEGDGFYIGDGVSYTATIRNTIVYNVARTGVQIQQSSGSGNPVLNLENVTVFNCGSGTASKEGGVLLERSSGNPVINARNVISLGNQCGGGCTEPDFNEAGTLPVDWGTSTNNMSSDASAKGANPLTGRSAANQFVSTTPGVENLHLRFGSEALDTALDLSSQFFTDIDGQSRLGLTWDRGADEAFCKVYWTEEANNKIRRSDLDGSNPETLNTFAAAGEIPRGIALHIAGGKMYWAEGGTKIRRANLDGSNVQDVVTGLSLPRDVDVDPVAGKVYWVDQMTGMIQRANFDGTVIENLVTGLSTSRAGPALDLVNGKMYWTEDGSNRIRRANLDGTVVEDLVISGLGGPFGIALDVPAGKMYWTDIQTDKIQRANLDGTVVEDLVTTGLVGARGIDLDLTNGKMYWVDYGAGKLQRANLDGSSVEDLFTGIDSPNGVTLGCPTAATTAVELIAFDTTGLDGEVLVRWETGSEMNNLGFHLYRSATPGGRYQRVTVQAIPGLGSSPAGARYSYRDRGLDNGVTYYYKLEDIESTGVTTLHGPVSATPSEGVASSGDEGTEESSLSESRITFGAPKRGTFEILRQGRGFIELELHTDGFYALPLDDGSVALEIPGFETVDRPDAPSIPVKRAWIELGSEADVKIVSVQADPVHSIGGLHPALIEATASATREGAVRVSRSHRHRTRSRRAGLVPYDAARVLETGFQGGVPKALVELAPLRWDPWGGRLTLTKRLVVRLKLTPTKKPRREREGREAAFHLATTAPGVYAVGYDSLGLGRRGGVPVDSIRLSRLGEPVSFHVEGERFGPGSVLYFVSEGAALNPYGHEAVFELSWSPGGKRMGVESAKPIGSEASLYRHRIEREQNRLYQPALLRAPDLWLWETLFAPAAKEYPFEVTGLAEGIEEARLEVWLQGTSDFRASPDHHVRLFVNGSFVAEASWDGKTAGKLAALLPDGVLVEGTNTLEVENVGDTEAAYSMVMLDKFALTHARVANALGGELRGLWTESGGARVGGVGDAVVLDVTGESPRWLTDVDAETEGEVRFRVEGGREYWVVDAKAIRTPDVRPIEAPQLRDAAHRADLVLIGPGPFEGAALPLIERRREQGLEVVFASVEDIYVEFGYGETRPEAIREFLAFAYREWREPSLRYVLLLGDATFDYKNYYGLDRENRVPPLMVQTSFLRTVSDPAYAMVHGDDRLPDVAIGRLPAANADEVERLVRKVLAYETSGADMSAPIALVADDADHAGNFEAHAEELASGLLADHETRKIYLSRLGAAATRQAIVQSFGEGASLMSYLGHGGIHLWADEKIFDNRAVAELGAQSQQPLLLTMNCLNGYFHFPYFDSLSEKLLKADEKGVIAAFSPSGLSLDAPAHRYHRALLGEILHGAHERLGDAILAAQEEYAATGAYSELLSIYHLLGDPTLPLSIAE